MTASHGPVAGLSWTEIPTHILRAELQRRQDAGKPECGTKGGQGSYNTPLHVFALALILGLSTAACSFPIIVKRFPGVPVPHHFLFLSRHFGTGVLIATAFVHLLPTAFQSLTDPCLPYFWNKGYPAIPGLIAMTSCFVVVGVEMFFASQGAGHVHAADYETFGARDHGTHQHPHPTGRRSNSVGRYRDAPLRANGQVPDIVLHDLAASSDNLMAGRSPSMPATSPQPSPLPQKHHHRGSLDRDESDLDLDIDELGADDGSGPEDESSLLPHPPAHKNHHHHHAPPEGATQGSEMTEAQHQRQLLQCLLLEAGILFHSVFIGMALSVATGTAFIVLLVAISFHQTFEGFALGSRISAIRFPSNSPKPWLMALAYGTTTPVGQAIGLGIHSLYDPLSQTGLLTVGFMNAISSGLLLFAGLVELLAEDFLSEESYVVLSGKRRLHACASVVAGAGLMALVGAWA